jgi:HSP20 family protein
MAISPAFNRTADPFGNLFDTLWGGAGARGNANLMRPAETDVIETEREIRVVAEMPGLKRENIEIDVENNVLTLRGEKREERTEGEQNAKYHLAERRYGVFTRSFVLPRDVDAERISASFENGVLTVVIPKSERARRRRIEIGGMESDNGSGPVNRIETQQDQGGQQNG